MGQDEEAEDAHEILCGISSVVSFTQRERPTIDYMVIIF